jgi:hypothetical protein
VTAYVNKEAMRQHLQQISQATPTGQHAVVMMDGAGWHTDDTAFTVDSITLVGYHLFLAVVLILLIKEQF